MSKKIWIAWENHRRNQSISRKISAKLFEIIDHHPRTVRYPFLIFKTLRLLKREKPDSIIVQNPSIMLSIVAVIIGKFYRITIIVDAHNVGVFFEHKNSLIESIGQIINKTIIKNADLTIVTTPNFAKYVGMLKGKPFVLPDPFPIFKNYERLKLEGRKNILFICTFALDEPYHEVFKAASLLADDIFIHVTGKCDKQNLPKKIPNNIKLTGFVTDDKYLAYLHSVDVVIDLTNREDCLVCGAYEAISAQKPLILSEKKCLIDYFEDAALYTDNSPSDISSKIFQAIDNSSELIKNAKELKQKKTKDWVKKKDHLEELIAGEKYL